MNYIEQLKKYHPYNYQEEKDKEIMLKYINDFDNILSRENEYAHFTASSWVINKDKTKVLMVYHNIYNSWSWTGGHADGSDDLFQTAVRELKEETGIKNIEVVSKDIFSIEIICVDGHIKNNKYVSSHLHLNLTYLFIADTGNELFVKSDENSGVKWIDIDSLSDYVSEEWVLKNIYNKLNEKLTR